MKILKRELNYNKLPLNPSTRIYSHQTSKREFLEEVEPKPKTNSRKLKPIHYFTDTSIISALTFNKNGSRIITAGKGNFKIWDVNDSKNTTPLTTFSSLKDSYIRTCKLTNDQRFLITSGETQEITIWDFQTLTPTISKVMETENIFHYSLVLSKDSKTALSCMGDGRVGIWDIEKGILQNTFKAHHQSISCIDISDDGNTIYTGSLDKVVKEWDWRQSKEISSFEFDTQIFSLGSCPKSVNNENIISVGLSNGTVSTINLTTKKKTNLPFHTGCVLALKYSPKGDYLVTGGKDKKIVVSVDGKIIDQNEEKGSILCMDITQDSKRIGVSQWSTQNSAIVYEME